MEGRIGRQNQSENQEGSGSKKPGVPDLGDRIKYFMEDLVNLPELSAKSGISVAHLNRIIEGKVTNPTIESVMRIAGGLGITVSDLIGETDTSREKMQLGIALSQLAQAKATFETLLYATEKPRQTIKAPEREETIAFSQEVEDVLIHASDTAVDFGHNYIGTEHLLIGLFKVPIGRFIFETFNLNQTDIEKRVEDIVGRGSSTKADEKKRDDISLTQRAKKVIELAVEETRRGGKSIIMPTHLLAGLVKEGQGIGVSILELARANVDFVQISRFFDTLPPETIDLINLNYNPDTKQNVKGVVKDTQDRTHLVAVRDNIRTLLK